MYYHFGCYRILDLFLVIAFTFHLNWRGFVRSCTAHTQAEKKSNEQDKNGKLNSPSLGLQCELAGSAVAAAALANQGQPPKTSVTHRSASRLLSRLPILRRSAHSDSGKHMIPMQLLSTGGYLDRPLYNSALGYTTVVMKGATTKSCC